MSLIQRFVCDQTGTTAIEYALIAAGIAMVILATVNAVGVQVNSIFTNVSTQLGAQP
jgi:pilus assembly protein Flp/PilA